MIFEGIIAIIGPKMAINGLSLQVIVWPRKLIIIN